MALASDALRDPVLLKTLWRFPSPFYEVPHPSKLWSLQLEGTFAVYLGSIDLRMNEVLNGKGIANHMAIRGPVGLKAQEIL